MHLHTQHSSSSASERSDHSTQCTRPALKLQWGADLMLCRAACGSRAEWSVRQQAEARFQCMLQDHNQQQAEATNYSEKRVYNTDLNDVILMCLCALHASELERLRNNYFCQCL